MSPSTRREWIEITRERRKRNEIWSPSTRREWIEIESSDTKHTAQICLPPLGGSGLKYLSHAPCRKFLSSPSTRREWIEIQINLLEGEEYTGSPSTRREWIEISYKLHIVFLVGSLPPLGGSGLKFQEENTKLEARGLPPLGGSGLKSVSLKF